MGFIYCQCGQCQVGYEMQVVDTAVPIKYQLDNSPAKGQQGISNRREYDDLQYRVIGIARYVR